MKMIDVKTADGEVISVPEAAVLPNGKKTMRKRPDSAVQVEPGDNTRMLNNNLAIWKLPKIDLHDPDAIRDRILEYFEICAQRDMKPSMAALAMSLKIDRQKMWQIANGQNGYEKAYSAEVRYVLKEVQQMLAAMMEDYLQNGKVNPASGIFLAKNLGQGYKDVSDLVVSQSAPEAGYNADDIAKRYQITGE